MNEEENTAEETEAEGIPAGVTPEIWEIGKAQYITCASCHGPNGEGVEALKSPPLANSEWVNGPAENLIRIQLRGLTGPITVDGQLYEPLTPMAALAYQTDEQIAAVLTYVRNSFGNEASAIDPAEVAKFREVEITSPPKSMLTVADLVDPTQKDPEPEPEVPEPKALVPKPPAEGSIPKADSYLSFPFAIPVLLFLVVTLAFFGKMIASRD